MPKLIFTFLEVHKISCIYFRGKKVNNCQTFVEVFMFFFKEYLLGKLNKYSKKLASIKEDSLIGQCILVEHLTLNYGF